MLRPTGVALRLDRDADFARLMALLFDGTSVEDKQRLAECYGVGVRSIYRWCVGRSRPAGLRLIQRILTAAGLRLLVVSDDVLELARGYCQVNSIMGR